MGIVITSKTVTFHVDFDGTHVEDHNVIFKISDVVEITELVNNETVNIILESDSQHMFNFNTVDSFNGDTSITSQRILRDKFSSLVFGETYP
jgi:hypothetical protein